MEIGPYDNPSCVGENVKYFDIHDAETLKKLAEKNNRPVKKTPEKIHYVEPNGDLSIVNEKFDMVFSSHVIEHQPDLILHLQNVGNILNEGGLYVLVIPDKRYCFDHYRNGTSLFEVIDVHVNKRSRHTFKNIAEARCMRAHNSAVMHWLGLHGELDIKPETVDRAINVYEKSMNGGGMSILMRGALLQKFLAT